MCKTGTKKFEEFVLSKLDKNKSMMANVTTLIQALPCQSQPGQWFEPLSGPPSWGCLLSGDSLQSQTVIIATNVSVPPQKH